MPEKINIMYLRQSAGGGGGADSVIMNSLRHINHELFDLTLVYLRNINTEPLSFNDQLQDLDVNFFELTGSRFFDWPQFRELVRLTKKYRIRIVHSHDAKSNFYSWLLRFFVKDLFLVSTVHGWTRKSGRGIFYEKLDHFILRRFDRVIAVSRDLFKTVNCFSPGNATLLHNAIDTEAWRPTPQTGSRHELFTVAFVGRLSREKGALEFIRIAGSILNRDAGCRFLVVGDGPEKAAMQALSLDLPIARIKFLGHVEHHALPGIYREIDLLLLCSHTEGLPISILEAAAMKIPVVATDVGGVGEIIDDKVNGLLAADNDIDSLADHVLAVKNDNDLAGRLKENGRKKVEKFFSMAANIRKLENIYAELSQD